jgi:hypothetical protein
MGSPFKKKKKTDDVSSINTMFCYHKGDKKNYGNVFYFIKKLRFQPIFI